MSWTWTYHPALDGLRALAVYLVLAFHAGLAAVGGGFIGVDLFFVLSGFVVANVLLAELDETGSVRLGRFYARRVRRLLPAALVVVVATSAVFVLVAPAVRRAPLVADAQSALLYVANWRFLSQADDYFAEDTEQSPFLHFWSLAIEEQFYLVFPVLLLVLHRLLAGRTRAVLLALAGLFGASVIAQLVWSQVNQNHAYYGTDARLYQLLAGVLLALVLRAAAHRTGAAPATGLAVTGVLGLLLLGSGLLEMSPSWRGLAATAVAVSAVGGLALAPRGPVAGVFSQPVVVHLGRISYGTYLWHWPVILVIQEVLTVRPVIVAVLTVGVASGLAALSYEVLEMPVRTSRVLARFRWRAVGAGVAASAVLAVVAVPTLLGSDKATATVASRAVVDAQQEQQKKGPAAQDDRLGRPVPSGIPWQEVAEDYGLAETCAPDEPRQCVVVKGGGPHIALVGDSHGRMLAPAFIRLAKEHDLTLSLNIVNSCPWQAGLTNLKRSKEHQETCSDRRGKWYEQALPELDPDLVVLTGNARDEESWADKLERTGGSDETLAELTLATTEETLETIEEQQVPALVIESIMGSGEIDTLECLQEASTLGECAVPVPDEPLVDSYYRTAATRNEHVHAVDLNPVFCPRGPQCAPVLDGTVVWRNPHHLTAQIVVDRRERLWEHMVAAGAPLQ